MRGVHLDPFIGLRFEPARWNSVARKHEPVRAQAVDHSQLEINVVWRGHYGLPFHCRTIKQPPASSVDAHQTRLLIVRMATGLLF